MDSGSCNQITNLEGANLNVRFIAIHYLVLANPTLVFVERQS